MVLVSGYHDANIFQKHRGGNSMYILFIILMIVICFLLSPGVSVLFYLDSVSFIILFLVAIPVLFSTGLIKDFNNAFKLSISKKKETTIRDLKRAIEAVALFQKVIITTGIFSFLFCMIIILIHQPEYKSLLTSIAVNILSPLYATVIALILQPIEVNLKLRLQDMLHE